MTDEEPDDEETGRILNRIRGGEEEARNELFARFRPSLRQFMDARLDRALQSRLDASDVIQDALLESSRRLHEYLAESHGVPFRVWLRRVANDRLVMVRRRHVSRQKRSSKREQGLPDSSSAALATRLLAQSGAPSENLRKRDLARNVREAVAELDIQDQEILLLRTCEGFSHQEAAWILGIEADAARQRMGRALVRLHKVLLARGIEGVGG